ncbi:MAG: translational GTPase TypA [Erysipelotrichales bacterium]|nr:translational GTPase TypA [Erysipelotrichales bacterium]
MMSTQKIINIAVIAHVDAGKSTLVDAFLDQSGVFGARDEKSERVMDSNDLERERGITIYSKNCSVFYHDYKINIVDTPGHADFSSEVERVIRTVDTVILLVDSSEGPMPQTRFVLQKSLELGLRPILLINKIDKNDARPQEVVDEVYELFLDLNANDEQLDFPILYGIAKQGIVQYDLDTPSDNIEPLFQTIVKHVEPYNPGHMEEPLQLQISALAYDEYIGRIGIGRIYRGRLKANQFVAVASNDGENVQKKNLGQIFNYQGLKRTAIDEAAAGDIVLVSGIPNISIGDTICDSNVINPLPPITIEEPTLSMNFCVNTSPFAGQTGKYVTSRNLRERLEKELEVNVGLKVEESTTGDVFKVSGRGELHLSILLENMRREGYEVAVSRPEVIMKRIDGQLYEPMEEVIISAPTEYVGTCISKLNGRKGIMKNMDEENGYTKIEYDVPTRGLIGFRSEFITDTHGEGTMVRHFTEYEPYKGEIPLRENGVLTSMASGTAMTYSLFYLQDRGTLFITPQTKVYEGMIIGMNNRGEDMDVNPTENKKMTAIRSTGRDEAMTLTPAKVLSLEEALEFISDDELVELTPTDIRLRKKYLTKLERVQANRALRKAQEENN